MSAYLCIDLKSFFASVECVERNLDPMTTRLVVADPERSEKTICLAITPALKDLGIKNRCRIFEIPETIDYIVAPPRMQKYIDYSTEIYGIYLKYVSSEDIYPYSIDECFLDVTNYLDLYHMTAPELGKTIMEDIHKTLGLRATCGVGTNLYLTKIALDITAKHSPDYIGILDEDSYKEILWDHKPLTDFWRIGPGTAKRLARLGIFTQRQIAMASEELIYNNFGIEGELLIDHAWGKEPCTIKDIKQSKSKTHSISRGQVLPRDYTFRETKLIIKEMMDLLCLNLVKEDVVCESVTIWIGYASQTGEGGDHGTVRLDCPTSASTLWLPAAEKLFEEIADIHLPIRKLNISCNNVRKEEFKQLNFFLDDDAMEREHKVQKAMVSVQERFGKNAVLKGMNMLPNATTKERNEQIGGHRKGAT